MTDSQKISLLTEALEAVAPSWLPPDIRDKRREALNAATAEPSSKPAESVEKYSKVNPVYRNSLTSPEATGSVEAVLRWKLSQFKPYGADDCKTCDSGRVTLFIANERCIFCAPDTYEMPKDLAPKLTPDSDWVNITESQWNTIMEQIGAAGAFREKRIAELEAEVNRLVFELDKSRDSHTRKIAQLEAEVARLNALRPSE